MRRPRSSGPAAPPRWKRRSSPTWRRRPERAAPRSWRNQPAPTGQRHEAGWFSLPRLLAYARREAMELRRDPIRLTVAFLGASILMLVLSYGITFDVENLKFAALDE